MHSRGVRQLVHAPLYIRHTRAYVGCGSRFVRAHDDEQVCASWTDARAWECQIQSLLLPIQHSSFPQGRVSAQPLVRECDRWFRAVCAVHDDDWLGLLPTFRLQRSGQHQHVKVRCQDAEPRGADPPAEHCQEAVRVVFGLHEWVPVQFPVRVRRGEVPMRRLPLS